MTCHKLSHFNSQLFILNFIWNYCRPQEAKKFSRTPGQNKYVATVTRYRASIAELLIRNLYSQVAELVQRFRTMLKKIYFGGGDQFFQISSGVKFLHDWGRKYLFIGRGGIILDRGSNLSKFIYRKSHRGTYHRGTWTGVFAAVITHLLLILEAY